MNLSGARETGRTTYHGKPHTCGSTLKYVSSMGCVPCNIAKNRGKLDDANLMKPYRTAAKKRKRLTAWRDNNPDKTKAQHTRHYERHRKTRIAASRKCQLKRCYGISVEEYDERLSIQNGVCAICQKQCKTGRRLAVDHKHGTTRVRGLLCARCNRGIGCFLDNPSLMRNAISYLERP